MFLSKTCKKLIAPVTSQHPANIQRQHCVRPRRVPGHFFHCGPPPPKTIKTIVFLVFSLWGAIRDCLGKHESGIRMQLSCVSTFTNFYTCLCSPFFDVYRHPKKQRFRSRRRDQTRFPTSGFFRFSMDDAGYAGDVFGLGKHGSGIHMPLSCVFAFATLHP